MKLTIKFQREGIRAKPVYTDYAVDLPAETTVFDALVAVRETQDGTMAFRGNCGVGFCGDCTVSINGAQKSSCLVSVGAAAKENVIAIQPDQVLHLCFPFVKILH